MTAAIWYAQRDLLLAQFCRLEETVRLTLLSEGGDVEHQLQAFTDELAGQRFESTEPSFQEEEYKAEAIAFYEDNLRTTQSEMASLAIIALYHHWERSVKWLIQQKSMPDYPEGLNGAGFNELKKFLNFDDLPKDCRRTFEDIDLGRLIVNVSKHGEGPSADCLRAKVPELFERSWLDENFDLPSSYGVNLIWVSPAHVDVVARAIRQFWQTLPNNCFPTRLPLKVASMLDGEPD